MNRTYNTKGPETCLEDDVFMMLWEYYRTHPMPDTADSRFIFTNMHLSGSLLPEAYLLPLENPDEKLKERIIAACGEHDFHSRYEVEHAIFWAFRDSESTWRAPRFHTPDDGYWLCMEDLKHHLKEVAEYDGFNLGGD